MSKNLVMILVALLIVGGGVVGFMVVSQDDSSQKTNQSTQDGKMDVETNTVFDAASMADASFVATITTTEGDKTIVGVMEHDNTTDSTKYSYSIDGQESTSFFTNDAYYLCQAATSCIKYPNNQIGSSFDPDSYSYSEEDFSEFKQNATHMGVEDCPAGSCDVWKVTKDSLETMIYIDTNTKRISQVQGNTANGSVKIVYEFKDVSITLPTNAQEIPNLQ